MNDSERTESRVPRRWLRVGVAAWTVIGVVTVMGMVLALLSAVSELVMPLVFAVMMGSVAYPAAKRLQRHGLKPAMAAVTVVISAILVGAGVVLITVKAIVQETAGIAHEIDRALAEMSTTSDAVGLDQQSLQRTREAIASIAAFIGRGLLTAVVGGVSAVIGFVGGGILALLIMYYVLKDGPEIRNWMVRQLPPHLQDEARSFLATSIRSVRAYWAGRSVLSAAVTVVVVIVSIIMGLPFIATIAVVNFIGGFVPYIGAFIGGGLATLLALADGGIGQALLMLAIVLACNLLLENLLEPRIMSGRLKIHPLMVLIATTTGGVVGGIAGLILAVPVTVVAIDLVSRLRKSDALSSARAKAVPLIRDAVSGEPKNGSIDPEAAAPQR
ncbi:MAG: hypothetical protein RLZZ623_2331 [Actinomycetota bacterium]|jgi:predicted PurR-regulated permease PerM